jgi:hypothetical protein
MGCRGLFFGLAGFLWVLSGQAVQGQPLQGPNEQRPFEQRALERTSLQAGMHLIRAELALDQASRARGLMFRERLGTNEGMLFVFEQAATQCFWMRNTLVPLTIAFLAEDGRIVNTADMEPKTETSHCSVEPVRFALEMERGWFAKRGIGKGERLTAPGLFRAP